MFPINKSELSFGEISQYWAPKLKWSCDMVQALLERAWWLGEIIGNSKVTRLQLLKKLFKRMRNSDFPAIVFVTPGSALPPVTIELSDGHLAVDLRPRVFVPSDDADTWSAESCIPAFELLAEKPSLEHYPEWSPGFCAIKLTRDEFFRWTTARGFQYSTFWEQSNDEATSPQLKLASKQMIIAEIRRVYDLVQEDKKPPPNIKKLPQLVQARLRDSGHEASARLIQEIGSRPEFKKRRRKPGKTLKSERLDPHE